MKNIVLVLATLLCIELLLQAVCFFSPRVDALVFKSYAGPTPAVLAGGALRVRGNPEHGDHDRNGYRNKTIPERASIVVLGDSHTYGTNVFREQAWPSLIQDALGVSVYNMGLGGYGQANNLLQLNQALEFSPDLVIVALYFGNDFFDNFKMFHYSETISGYLTEAERQQITQLENNEPLIEKAQILFGSKKRNTAKEDAPKENTARRENSAFRKWLAHNSALWALPREIKNSVKRYLAEDLGILAGDFQKATAAITPKQLRYSSIFEGEEWRTILTAPYRDLGNDRSDRRIDIGFELTLRVLPDMQNRISSAGAELVVLMLPTKESAFMERVSEPDKQIGYASLLVNEQRNRKQLKEFLDHQNIQYIDVLPALRNAKQQPYPQNADGHPNTVGHQLIADTVIGWLKAGHGSAVLSTAGYTAED